MMKTPIFNFVKEYKKNNEIRCHMPGHKGKSLLGCEELDITEIDGADNLYHADSIIKESELNASKLFDADTFYSTEGSSLSIRAMLYLATTNRLDKANKPVVLAARNVHKTFITAAALLDFDVDWMYSKEYSSYHSCIITPADVDFYLENSKACCVYVTSPDYLGNILDIKGISEVCHKHNVLLLVDNAHGCYLRFLPQSQHPINLGADMCADSAHKTLPALTGASYLHISKSLDSYYKDNAKSALGLFGSTSPSYLILQSLDLVNEYLEDNGYIEFCEYMNIVKKDLTNSEYTLLGNESLKITIDAKKYGYTGNELNDYLSNNNITVEFYDGDYVVLMVTPMNSYNEINKIRRVLLDLYKKEEINTYKFNIESHEKIVSIRQAMFSIKEIVNVENSLNRVLADTAVTCPPAVPILVCGERITQQDIDLFKYYGIDTISVIKQ